MANRFTSFWDIFWGRPKPLINEKIGKYIAQDPSIANSIVRQIEESKDKNNVTIKIGNETFDIKFF